MHLNEENNGEKSQIKTDKHKHLKTNTISNARQNLIQKKKKKTDHSNAVTQNYIGQN